jgi:hypothetical protein
MACTSRSGSSNNNRVHHVAQYRSCGSIILPGFEAFWFLSFQLSSFRSAADHPKQLTLSLEQLSDHVRAERQLPEGKKVKGGEG